MCTPECFYVAQYWHYCPELVQRKNMSTAAILGGKRKKEKVASSEDHTKSENMTMNED